MPMGYSHRFLRKIASWAIFSFFHEIRVIGSENVPEDGPVIVCCTHHNMMIDPGVLSCTFPHKRPLHYWAKASLFKHPIARAILLDAGNIPVDRGNKDNQVLFRGTFEALAAGDVVALFPEGTSYTEYKIMQVKDGAAWSALEYMKWARNNPKARDVIVVPAGITYVNKSKYRSSVVIEYGTPITLDQYMERFLLDEPGAARKTAKALTWAIETQLIQLTINAPDWDSLFAAKMTRELLWEDERSINLDEFVSISQTLVDIFSASHPSSDFSTLKPLLLKYYTLLKTTRLTNSVLSSLKLPRSLDPHHPTKLPTRLTTLLYLLRDTLASLVRLPFFFVPMLLHLPAYVFSRIGGMLVEHEEESQAQNKLVFGVLFLSLIYGAVFWSLWVLFLMTPIGAVIAGTTVYMVAVYHTRLIDDNYEHAKRLVAAWRILLGVWVPTRWDLDLSAVNYRAPERDPNNQFIKPKSSSTYLREAAAGRPVQPPPPPPSQDIPTDNKKQKRPPSRRLIRHVLRTRLAVLKALTDFLLDLERHDRRIFSSPHLGRLYGGVERAANVNETNAERAQSLSPSDIRGLSVAPSTSRSISLAPSQRGTSTAPDSSGKSPSVEDPVPSYYGEGDEVTGWRSSKEVVAFLRARGAKIVVASGRVLSEDDREWAASSDEEVETPEIHIEDTTGSPFETKEGRRRAAEDENLVWIPSGTGSSGGSSE